MGDSHQIQRLRARVAELDRKVFEYRALLKAGEALHNELELDKLCSLLTAIVSERLPGATVAVLLADPHDEVVRVRRTVGLPAAARGVGLPLEDGILRRMLLDRDPFSVVDVDGAPRFPDIWERHDLAALRSEVWVPMASKDAVLGVVAVGGLPSTGSDADAGGPGAGGAPSAAEAEGRAEFLRSLASQAAIAVSTAFLDDRTQSARQDLDQSLHKLSLLFDVTRALSAVSDLTHLMSLILDRAISGVNAQRGSLMLLDEANDELVVWVVRGLPDRKVERLINEGMRDCRRLQRGEGVAGRVLAEGPTIVVGDVQGKGGFAHGEGSNVRSIICVPLRSDDDVIGVLNMTNRRGEEGFSRQDEEILEALANQAAVASSRTRLYEAAISDSLTRLYIRRFMMHRLKAEVRRSVRYRQPLALVMCDIDHFKAVNDRHGHPAGDAVLVGVAALLREGLREDVDLPGRYGGEEFVLVLPNTTAEAGAVVAERLCVAVAQTAYGPPAEGVVVRMSPGVAGPSPDAIETPDELLSRADQALYRAKALGRNRVEVAPAPALAPGGRTASAFGGGAGQDDLDDPEEAQPTQPPPAHPSSGEFPTLRDARARRWEADPAFSDLADEEEHRTTTPALAAYKP